MGDVTEHALQCLREAGRIASAARSFGAQRVKPGASLREVCVAVEDEIHRRGAEQAVAEAVDGATDEVREGVETTARRITS